MQNPKVTDMENMNTAKPDQAFLYEVSDITDILMEWHPQISISPIKVTPQT
jgi:hypothetical protein